MSDGAPTTKGEALVRELRRVHDLIRRDLATVRRMADQIPAGLPAPQIKAGIESLAANGPLWHLRVNCLHFSIRALTPFTGVACMVSGATRCG